MFFYIILDKEFAKKLANEDLTSRSEYYIKVVIKLIFSKIILSAYLLSKSMKEEQAFNNYLNWGDFIQNPKVSFFNSSKI